MKEIRRLEMDERFGLCNSIHDSFLWIFPQTMLDEFVATVVPVMTAPSKVLTHPILAPGGLVVDVEVVAGKTWASMEELKIPMAAAAAPAAAR
jgi:hypothetical protein